MSPAPPGRAWRRGGHGGGGLPARGGGWLAAGKSMAQGRAAGRGSQMWRWSPPPAGPPTQRAPVGRNPRLGPELPHPPGCGGRGSQRGRRLIRQRRPRRGGWGEGGGGPAHWWVGGDARRAGGALLSAGTAAATGRRVDGWPPVPASTPPGAFHSARQIKTSIALMNTHCNGRPAGRKGERTAGPIVPRRPPDGRRQLSAPGAESVFASAPPPPTVYSTRPHVGAVVRGGTPWPGPTHPAPVAGHGASPPSCGRTGGLMGGQQRWRAAGREPRPLAAASRSPPQSPTQCGAAPPLWTGAPPGSAGGHRRGGGWALAAAGGPLDPGRAPVRRWGVPYRQIPISAGAPTPLGGGRPAPHSWPGCGRVGRQPPRRLPPISPTQSCFVCPNRLGVR